MTTLTIKKLPAKVPIVFMPMDSKGYSWQAYIYTDEIKSWVEDQIQKLKISPFFAPKENLVSEIVQEIERKGKILDNLKRTSTPPQNDIKRLEAVIDSVILFIFGYFLKM